MNLGYFVSIVKRDHPMWPRTAVMWQAQRMLDRHPFIQKAKDAGLANGRDLRERMEHGLGVWWDELEPLSPEERGFVLALVREAIKPKGEAPRAGLVTLELVNAARETEAYEEKADALAADWREKSNAPDKRVTKIGTLGDHSKARA